MRRLALPLLVTGLLFGALALRVSLAAAPQQAPRAGATPDHNAFVAKYCIECHDDVTKEGELTLERFDIAEIGGRAELGEKMVRKLRTGLMPKKGSLQPTLAARMAFVTALEARLDAAAAANPNPGRRMFQRLNRAEYAAAMRALFGLDIDVSSYLPADTISAGFDNIADVQTPSATVMQGYMRAAAYVSRVVVGDPSADATSATYDVPRTQSQKDRVDGAPFGTRGGTVVTHNFPADGKYKFQLLLHGEPAGLLFGRTVRDIQMEVAIDGERAALLKVDRWISESDPDGLMVSTPPIQVRAGARRIAATFIREFEGSEDDLIKPIDHTLADTQIGVGYGVTTLPHLRNLVVMGPFEVTGCLGQSDAPGGLQCRPTAPSEEVPCARRIIQGLATRAYRRTPSAQDIDAADAVLPAGRQGRRIRERRAHGAPGDAVEPAFPLPHRSGAGDGERRRPCTGSATSISPRVSRSSSGARFPIPN